LRDNGVWMYENSLLESNTEKSSIQRYDTSLINLNWIQVYQLAIDTLLFYDMQVNKVIFIFLIQRIESVDEKNVLIKTFFSFRYFSIV
jgi:hypothetical protein